MTVTIEPPGNHADARTCLNDGTYRDTLAWLGRTVIREALFEVNPPEIGRFSAMVEGPDENHRDRDAAATRYDAVIAPPGMLHGLGAPPAWHPQGRPEHVPLLALEVPLPGDTLINVATDSTLAAPIRVGEQLTFADRLTTLGTSAVAPPRWRDLPG